LFFFRLQEEFVALPAPMPQQFAVVEPVYHNSIFLFFVIVVLSGATDVLKPQWKLRRRQPRAIRNALREARAKAMENREWFSAQEIRDTRKQGAIGFLVGLALLICLQPSLGWVWTSIKTSTSGDTELAERLRPKLQSIVERNAIIGMTVVLVADGKEAIVGLGRRDLHTSKPPDGKTLYEIGSISKTFTGILLAHEIRNGRANLGDLVSDHLPDGMRLPDTTNAPVLLRHLATHSSGFPRKAEGMGGLVGTLFGRNTMRDVTSERFWSAVKTVQLRSVPGESTHYSNFGTVLLGTLLARHQHDSFMNMFWVNIGEPLGMTDTVIQPSDDQLSRWAQGYRSIVKLGPLALALEADNNELPDVLAGMGGFYSTGEDMLRYLKANLGLIKSPALGSMRLSHQKLEDWFDDHALGMNWLRRDFEGHTIVWHNGRMSGHRCFIGFNESQPVAVAILCNSQVNMDWYGAHLIDLLSEAPATDDK